MYELRVVYVDRDDMIWHLVDIKQDRSVVLRKITSYGNFTDKLISPKVFADYTPMVTEKDFAVTADVLKIPTEK